MKIKTSELQGAALDWAVGQAEGKPCHLYRINHRDRQPAIYSLRDDDGWMPAYSTDWSQGGPIIEREYIWLEINEWQCYAHKNGLEFYEGPTPLIAAMRCHCTSKLGDDIEIPEELV